MEYIFETINLLALVNDVSLQNDFQNHVGSENGDKIFSYHSFNFFFQDMFFLGFSGKSDLVTNNKSKNAGEFDEIV